MPKDWKYNFWADSMKTLVDDDLDSDIFGPANVQAQVLLIQQLFTYKTSEKTMRFHVNHPFFEKSQRTYHHTAH